MKKLQNRLLALLLIFSLVACGSAGDWQTQYDLGVRYLSDGNYEEAIIAFNAAIEIDPKQETTYLALADAYVGLGDYEQARQVLLDAQALLGQTQGLADKLAELGYEHLSAGFEADGMSVLADGLSVRATGSRSATITIDGLTLPDSYLVNRSDSMVDMAEYDWQVRMYTPSNGFSASSTWWAFEPGENRTVSLDEMQHSLWALSDNGGEWIADVTMSHTGSSISWTFTVPDGYEFDFSDVERYEVHIQSDPQSPCIIKFYTLTSGE